MSVPEKPKPKQRKKRKHNLSAKKLQQFLEWRLASLWVKDLEENAKMNRKVRHLAKRRRVYYIA